MNCHRCIWKIKSFTKTCNLGIEFPMESCGWFDEKCCECERKAVHKDGGLAYCDEHMKEVIFGVQA